MKNLLILAYHRILPEKSTANPLIVSAQNFEKQLAYLIREEYQFLTLKQFYAEYLKNKSPLKRKICLLTFDDGYRDNYAYALPILQKFGLQATFFITTGYIGRGKPFYWDYKNIIDFQPLDFALAWPELKEMQAAGMEIGSHTVNHYELTSLMPSEINSELKDSKAILDRELSYNTTALCYPRGAYQENLEDLAKQAGYQIGVITPVAGSITETHFALNRVGIYGPDNLWRFKLKVSGLYRLFKFLKRLGQK